jgi:hypothetical protein
MSDPNSIVLFTFGAFGAAALLGYAVVRVFGRKRVPIPKQNAILRISSLSSMYRAHFIGELKDGWAFTPPLQRDGLIPIKIGEPITIETVVDGGIAVYRSTLLSRGTHPDCLIVDKPAFWHVENRREDSRIANLGHLSAKLDGDKVSLMDVSACGARIRSQAERSKGDRVHLEIAGMNEPISGYVVDTDRRGDRFFVRMRFEEATDLAPLLGV